MRTCLEETFVRLSKHAMLAARCSPLKRNDPNASTHFSLQYWKEHFIHRQADTKKYSPKSNGYFCSATVRGRRKKEGEAIDRLQSTAVKWHVLQTRLSSIVQQAQIDETSERILLPLVRRTKKISSSLISYRFFLCARRPGA